MAEPPGRLLHRERAPRGQARRRSPPCSSASARSCAGPGCCTGDVLDYATAAAALDPSDLVDLYWAGRVTLVTRRDAIPRYDAVFLLVLPRRGPRPGRRRAGPHPAGGGAGPGRAGHPGHRAARRRRPGREQEARLGLMASDAEKRLALQAVHRLHPGRGATPPRIMARLRLTPPRRRTRRWRSGSSVPPTCAAPSASRCASPASPASCTGGGAGLAAAADPHPGRVRVDGRLLPGAAAVRLRLSAPRPGSRCSASAPG